MRTRCVISEASVSSSEIGEIIVGALRTPAERIETKTSPLIRKTLMHVYVVVYLLAVCK